jgi:hypothetical protein
LSWSDSDDSEETSKKSECKDDKQNHEISGDNMEDNDSSKIPVARRLRQISNATFIEIE